MVYRGKIVATPKGQQGENHFGTYNFLAGMYEASPGAQPMIELKTGAERRVLAKDNILLPNYQLPTPAQLKQASKTAKDYNKNKALKAFRKKVEAHTKIYPKPTYYDHKQYRLPHCIIESEDIKAPYHVDEDDSTDEWTQQTYTTHKEYIFSPYPGYDADNKPQYYMPIWFMETIDTTTINTFDKEHSVSGPYKGFRCVMPNLW